MGFSIKGIIGTAAPWLATAIGGPMAGQAVSMISKSLGLKDDAKLDDVSAALQAGNLTGDQLLKLKEADQEFQKAMTLAGFENTEALAKLAMEDRASARDRETKVRDFMPKALGLAIVGSFIFVVLATLHGWSKVDSALAGSLIGYLSAKAEQVVSYYFGSSLGSTEKTALLAQAPSIDTPKKG